MTQKHIILGIDFDNTIISYDDVLHERAQVKGLIDKKVPKSKKTIRDNVRTLSDGERKWQELQAEIYGPMIGKARLSNGVKSFIKNCHAHHIQLYIISHKTKFATMDKSHTNLRTAALNWMKSNRFFKPDGLGLTLNQVFFEDTRKDKIHRVAKLNCTHFIDDLIETFMEERFPDNVISILYAKDGGPSNKSNRPVVKDSWERISSFFFNGGASEFS